jgi:dipeptidyl-peptidase 9
MLVHFRLQWMPVFCKDASNLTSINASRELQLLLERKRLPAMGINSYEFHKRSGKIIFQACNSLYMCLDTGFNATPLFPTELRTCQYHDQNWAPIDPKICPQNSDLIAYTCGNDIYVTHSISGHDQRLTFSHGGKRNDPVSAGVPSYVMQEEFNRYEGFWWQPATSDGIYRICFEEVDESDVSIYTFPSAHAGEREEYRFPRAGCPNARSTLKMVEFRLSESLRITDVCIKEMQTPLNFIFPYLEYIVRIGWTPCANFVWAQLLSRQQQLLELILIPLEQFCCEPYNSNPSSPESCLDKHIWKPITDKPNKPIQVIYTERSNHWINIHDLLCFLVVSDKHVQYLWSSEETGFRHLYHITSSIDTAKPAIQQQQPQNGLGTHSAFYDDTPVEDNLKARVTKKITLTSGEWEVMGKNIWRDPSRHLIYFMGSAHSVLEKHLYVLNMTQPNKIKLLTTPGSTHSIEFNEVCCLLVLINCH